MTTALTPKLVDDDAHHRTQEKQIMLEEATFLRSFGTDWDRIAVRLGVQPASLQKTLSQARAAGLPVPE